MCDVTHTQQLKNVGFYGVWAHGANRLPPAGICMFLKHRKNAYEIYLKIKKRKRNARMQHECKTKQCAQRARH